MKLYKHTNGTCNASGPAIRALRERAGISQEQLAAKLQLAGLNLNQKAVSRIETGDRVVPDFERGSLETSGIRKNWAEPVSFFMRKSAKMQEMSLTIYTRRCIIILQGKGKPE